MSYVLNFVAEILLILTYDLGPSDQTMNDSHFRVMSVAGFEVQITTSMSRLPVHFHGEFGPLFMTKISKNERASLASTSIVNLMVGLTLTTKVSWTYLSHLAGLWVPRPQERQFCIW
jgi:hypothetical protein